MAKGVIGMRVLLNVLEFLGIVKAGEMISGSRSSNQRLPIGRLILVFIIKATFFIGLVCAVGMGLILRLHTGA